MFFQIFQIILFLISIGLSISALCFFEFIVKEPRWLYFSAACIYLSGLIDFLRGGDMYPWTIWIAAGIIWYYPISGTKWYQWLSQKLKKHPNQLTN